MLSKFHNANIYCMNSDVTMIMVFCPSRIDLVVMENKRPYVERKKGPLLSKSVFSTKLSGHMGGQSMN